MRVASENDRKLTFENNVEWFQKHAWIVYEQHVWCFKDILFSAWTEFSIFRDQSCAVHCGASCHMCLISPFCWYWEHLYSNTTSRNEFALLRCVSGFCTKPSSRKPYLWLKLCGSFVKCIQTCHYLLTTWKVLCRANGLWPCKSPRMFRSHTPRCRTIIFIQLSWRLVLM